MLFPAEAQSGGGFLVRVAEIAGHAAGPEPPRMLIGLALRNEKGLVGLTYLNRANPTLFPPRLLAPWRRLSGAPTTLLLVGSTRT